MLGLLFLVLSVCLSQINKIEAFKATKCRTSSRQLHSKLYEKFDLNFKNPDIETDKLIFSEKQLREFTASYSVDNRINPIDFIKNLFSPKDESDVSQDKRTKAPLVVTAAELQEKTASFVKGDIDGKKFYAVLKSAFGDKVNFILPEILSNLPSSKAGELSKAAK